jgi:chromosome segregation and condensation protein ScpB
MLYGTTREFLRVFGLASATDLPQAKDLRANPS